MGEIYLGLAIHNHQPVGNFDWVFREAYERSYLPMVELLERHPRVRLSLHYTGPLLDWLRSNAPEFLPRVAALAARGQVELIGGGYYEPILSAIPDRDKVGQMRRMSQVLEAELGYRPTGMWLAERVWEPHLPYWIAEAGLRWTVVDDTHFKLVGLKDDDLFGYYITEEQGRQLRVFGTSKLLRYYIPWRPVEEVIEYLRTEAKGEGRIAVMGDDGEKFGMWPDTYRHCWQDGWMERFFIALEQNSHWLHTVPLGEYVERFPPLGRVYLPTASYAEMMEWALPAPDSYEFSRLMHELESEGRKEIARFMRGGFWRYFLVKYPEVNAMHKKMLRVHRKVWEAHDRTSRAAGQEDLWAAQCNCPYWHGVFGGIYMTDIRATTYRHLVTAEEAADRALHGDAPWVEAVREDYDCDGQEEVLVEGSRMNLYFSSRSGAIVEWDWRPVPFNLLATMARRPEAYHRTLIDERLATEERSDERRVRTIHEIVRAKEPGLGQRLFYDRYDRHSLLDHFLEPGTALAAFVQAEYSEQGDFVGRPYRFNVVSVEGGVDVELEAEGVVRQASGVASVHLRKIISVRKGADRVEVQYLLSNRGQRPLHSVFGSEWNLNLLGGGGNPQAYCLIDGQSSRVPALDATEERGGVRSVVLGNRWLGLEARLTVSQPAILWRFPVETVSNSEGGFERVYQGTCVLLSWPLDLAPRAEWQVRLVWELSRA